MNLIETINKFKNEGRSKQAFGSLIRDIKKNDGLTQELLSATKFLDIEYLLPSISQRFYHIWFSYYRIETCPYCTDPKKFTFNNKFSEIRYEKKDANYCGTCSKEECNKKYTVERNKLKLKIKYGTDNPWNIPGYREKIENTNLEKYGTKYHTSSKNFLEKTKITNKERYGGHHLTNKDIMDKQRKTNMERYGVDCCLKDRQKLKEGMIKKYGVEFNMQGKEHKKKHKEIMNLKHGGIFLQSDSIREKTQKTNIERYGYIFCIQNDVVFDKATKNSRKWKDYEFPSGRKIKLQGYENLAIDYLLNSGILEDDIIVGAKNIKEEINIHFIYDINKKYFPDLYIKSKNLIIEVKSEYTFHDNFDINMKKKDCVISNNINYEIYIFDPTSNLKLRILTY